MILRSLEIEGFRCFDGPVHAGAFGPGLNLLCGENGTGKSTLLRALRHALVDSYSVGGEQVKQSMRPWGRQLSPRISVVFQDSESTWRIEKRFLDGPYSKLQREEAGVFRPFAEGRQADDRVRKILLADAASKGLAGEAQLGLLQVLWTPQGAPVLPEAWSAESGGRLRRASRPR